MDTDNAEQIERAATGAQQHVLRRDFGDWDEAEEAALAAIVRAERAQVCLGTGML